jgi:non-ribosomal peptide synthetase component F
MTAPSFVAEFERQVDATPGAVAVSFEARTLTYGELDERANRLARRLVADGIGPDSVVAICGERSPELMIAVLGALKAGAGYLPLDASYPGERLVFMLEDSRTSFLIRQRGLALDLPGARPPELEIHSDHPVLRDGDATRLPHRHRPENLAYAIYTSGSTGKPKGVLHTTAGYLVYAAMTHQLVFDPREARVRGDIRPVRRPGRRSRA